MKVIARKKGRAIREHVVNCPECGARMALKESKHGYFYGCSKWFETKCSGSHGAHPNGKPLGIPANKATKLKRIITHGFFDKLWVGQPITRDQAYRWLQKEMRMTEQECHIGRFNMDECDMVIYLVSKFLKENSNE